MKKGKAKKVIVTLLIFAMISTSVSVIAFQEDVSWQIKKFDATPKNANIYESINFVLEIDEFSSSDNSNSDLNDDQQQEDQDYTANDNQSEGFSMLSDDENDNYIIISSSNTNSKYHYKIDFGDRKSIAGYTNNKRIEFRHSYKESGEYTPTATVRNLDKDSTKEKRILTPIIIEDNGVCPVALIEAPNFAQEGDSVLFDGSKSYDPDGEIVDYKWTFGDEDGFSGETVEYIFSSKGSYNVILEVTDNDGLTSKTTFMISIDYKPRPASTGIDQVQDDASGGFVRIYGNVKAAQSFKTKTYGLLTSVDIFVERDFSIVNDDASNTGNEESSEHSNSGGVSTADEESSGPILRLLNRFSKFRFINFIKEFISRITNAFKSQTGWKNLDSASNNNGNNADTTPINGALRVTIREGLDGEYVTSASLDSRDIAFRDKGWVSFSFSPVEIELNKEYFIEVSQSGGDENHYYKWYYGNGNCYADGKAFVKESSSWEESSNDFAFRTYGEKYKDGVVTRWALLIALENYQDDRIEPREVGKWDAWRIRDALQSDGFNWNINVLVDGQATKSGILSAIEEIYENADYDDLVFISMASHGLNDVFSAYDQGIPASDISERLDPAKTTFININCCQSGSFIDDLQSDNRIILTSCKASETSSQGGEDWGASPHISMFTEAISGRYVRDGPYYNRGDVIPDEEDGDYNDDGYVTAEEAYMYVYNFMIQGHSQTPQLSDGYLELSNNQEDLILTQPNK